MSLESDESDHIGFLGEQSDSEGSDASADDSDGAGPSSHALFDLEAADSDDRDSDGDDDDDIDGGRPGSSDLDACSETYSFPQFARLPFELRHRIWEYFCPDLTAKSRVYWLRLALSPALRRGVPPTFVILEGPFVEQQTRPARTMLAVHHQSRQMALKAFPDSLSILGDGIVRFSSARDVVFLDCTDVVRLAVEFPRLPGFAEHVRNLAIEPAAMCALESRELVASLVDAFGALETLYYMTDPTNHQRRHLRWCLSDPVKHYSLSTFEEQTGLGEDGEHVYCWPDVNHPDFSKDEIPLEDMADNLRKDGIHGQLIRGATLRGLSVWPMVQFLRDDFHLFNNFRAWHGSSPPWDSSSQDSSDDDPEPDEYESEGIDDSEISDADSQESDTHDLIVLDDDSDDDEGVDGSRSSSRSQSPHPRSQPATIDLTADDDDNLARFSSPEHSSATLRVSDESENESDQPAARTSRRKRPRARVVESESEEDDPDDDVPRKRARIERRQPTIVISSDGEDDGEDGGEAARVAQRRSRVVIVDDSDEENDGERAADDDGGGDGPGSEHEWSGLPSSDDEEEGSDSDGGAATNKPLSLAEKLQLHRDRNPIPASEDGDDSEMDERRDSDEMSGDDMSGDDYDARDYADFQDDEEGNQVSDDGGDDDQEAGEEYDESDGY
ncbi:hypothetical protein C8A05DRAFT_43039 [Staphylotrichum tortipilum]|uniref:2EXR domain-containing protein n=1 Tax=Staphylotrichum tortipilum TaxID=2831512 RepID=A0AAN6MNV0_9PEZI|nr:hypothetical protein C8A05DRAFT_43039 [Staphylotrichum longicolle]